MKPTARLKSAVARADGGPPGLAPADAPAPPEAFPPAPPDGDFVAAPDVLPAFACAEDPAAPAADAVSGFSCGADTQALNSTARTHALIECRINILRDFRLAVARRLQLRQHFETLLHPLVVHTILRPHGVDLVRLDGLLFEWENLLLQQRVVLFELLALEVLRPLRAHDIVSERPVQLSHFVGRSCSDLGDLVLGCPLVTIHRVFERLALRDQALLQRRRQANTAECIASRLRHCQLRFRREIVRAVSALRPRLRISLDDFAIPVILLRNITAL